MLAEAEDALVAHIKASVLCAKLRAVDTLPDLEGDSLVKKFATDAPAVYVAPAASFGITDSIMDVGFGIACVARNAGGQDKARKGDSKLIGMYQIAEMIASMMNGYQAGQIPLYATGISIMNDEKIFKAGLQVAVVTLQGRAMLASSIDESTLDDFETMHSQYDIPPHETATEHGKWKQEPPDHSTSKPELTDNLTVQS